LSATAAGNGELTIENRAAGMYDNGKLPLTTFNTKFRRVNDQISFDRIAADLGSSPQSAGKLHGQGRYSNGALDMVLDVDRLDLHRLDQRLHPTLLAGNIQLRHVAGKQHLLLALNEPIGKNRVALNARATMSDAKISIDATELRLGNGHIAASANIDLSGTQAFSAKGEVTAFRLQDLGKFSQLPTLDLSGSFSVQGSRLPKLNTDLAFQIRDSRIGGHPLAGGGRVRVNSERISVPEFLLTAGDNHLDAHGELSQGAGKLSFTLTAPNLAQLGPGFGGTFNGDGTAQGSFQKPHIVAHWMGRDVHLPAKFQALQTQGNADLVVDRSHPSLVNTAAIDVSAQGLQIASQRYEALSAHMQFSPQADAPFMLDIHGKNIVTERLQADNMSISAQGTTSKHIIDIALAEAGARQNWIAHGSGGLRQLDGAAHWQGTIDRFDATGRFVAHLASPAMLSVAEHRIQLDQFRLDANTARITIEKFTRDGNGIATRGNIDHLQLTQILGFVKPSLPVAGDLQLGAVWDVSISDAISGTLKIQRQNGDVTMHGSAPITLGLGNFDASVTAQNGQATLRINADGRQLGHIDVNAQTSITSKGSLVSDAPVSGSIKMNIPSLTWVGPLISPSMVSEGQLKSDIALAGTLANPKLTGRITANRLRLLFGELGIDLPQGVLDSQLSGNTLTITHLAFHSEGGTLTATGPISFSDGKPSIKVSLKAEHFPLLSRSDRKLVFSGSSEIDSQEGRAQLKGAFDIDSGNFDIGREDMPQLSDDVVITGATKKASDALAAAIDVDVKLGNDLVVKGRGLDARLAGEMHLSSEAHTPLHAQGSINVASGTYTAYGRKLAIEEGTLRFNGPVDNPALNILAMRRGEEVEAGVTVRGTALAPRVTLISEPTVPDPEKLSWLVLGRGLSTAGAADLGALQGAAGALLSQGAASGVQSQIATAFGLDDVRIDSQPDNLQQRIITLGKRLSSKLYIGYEQSLQTAGSVVHIRYTLSPRLTLEGEAGTRSALSLFYNITFD